MSRNNPRVEVPGHEIRGRWEKDSEDQDASASGGDLVAKNAVFEKEVESSVSRKQLETIKKLANSRVADIVQDFEGRLDQKQKENHELQERISTLEAVIQDAQLDVIGPAPLSEPVGEVCAEPSVVGQSGDNNSGGDLSAASRMGREPRDAMFRHVATKRCVAFLVLVLVGAIVVIIVGTTVGFNVAGVSAAVLDCLKSGLSNDKCLNVTVPDIIPGRGPGGGSNGGGSTPAPRRLICGEHLHKKYFPDDLVECQQFGYIEKGFMGVNGDCGDFTTVLNTTNCTANICNDTTTTPALTTTTTSPPQTTAPTQPDTNETNSTTTTPEPTTTPPPTTTPTPCQMETCRFCFFTPRKIRTPPPTTTPPPVNVNATAQEPSNITATPAPTGERRLLLLDAVLREGEGDPGSSAQDHGRQRHKLR